MILPHEQPGGAAAPLDLDLIRKYSVAGPRYTSYPPATRFEADIAPEKIDAAIAADNRTGAGPISLYFHLPFCESLCWYCGCNTVITRRRAAAGEVRRRSPARGGADGAADQLRAGRSPRFTSAAGRRPSFRRRN